MRSVGIDPSSKTGFVALDAAGKVLRAKELTGVGDKDPKRMATLIDEIMAHIQPGDIVAIEGFAHNAGFGKKKSQSHDFQYGLGWGIRIALHRRGIKYIDVAPTQLKKFVGVTGWEGETGSKRRLTDKEKKKAVMEAVRNRYSFFHPSDNVNDAFVLAKIAETLHDVQNGQALECYRKEEADVIQAILSPSEKKRKKAAK
jgi:crossover junction endodeoxyribonuclease RuvC